MKKKVLIILLFVLSTNLSARQPAINYALIYDWCMSLNAVSQPSLQTLATYLQNLETFAQCNVTNPICFTTQEGKALQHKLDENVEAILQDHILIPIYQHFTLLIKQEIGQEKILQLGRRKKEYKILAAVAQGCLECVKKKLSI